MSLFSLAHTAVSVLVVLSQVNESKSRICTQADNCNLQVAQCSDAALLATCTYQFQRTISFSDQNAAINACKTKFGAASTPVTPGDNNVNQAVFNLCNSHRFFDMRRRAGALCNQWETLAGAPISFLNFDQNEPSNGGANCASRVLENCVGFKFQNGNARWHDSGCTPSGGSTTFVAQCVVCDVPPPTTTTTTTLTTVPTTPTTSFFVDFTSTTTTTGGGDPIVTPSATTAPTTTKTINIGIDTGGSKAPAGATTGGGSGNINGGDGGGDGGGLSDAALGGLIAGILCCCLCLLLLLALFVRRRGQKEQELKVIAEATPHMEPRYAPPHDVDVGQYGPTPVSPTYKQFPNADAGASWNGGPPPPVLMMGAGGGNMNSARQYGSPDHTNTLVGGSGGMQTFQDLGAAARQMPPAAYFPSSGANDLPSLPPLPPYPQGLNNQWGDIQQQQQQFYQPQYSADQWSQQPSEQFDNSSLRKRDEQQQSLYGASNLFQSVREGSQQEEYGTLSLQQPTSTYGLH